jgi:hypothetical protein
MAPTFTRALIAALPAGSRRGAEAGRIVARLPVYQVALWPDGWDPLPDGGLRIRDTDRMAEARRWYGLAERQQGVGGIERVMGLHGTFVPRPVVDLRGRRFTSERAASVALQLIAGEWIQHRRAQLLRDPLRALAERSACWSGSRWRDDLGCEGLRTLLDELLALCVREGLIPRAGYRLRVTPDDGFGVAGHRCTLETRLESYARNRLREVLIAGLVPWNRAVARDGRARPVIGVEIRGPARGR